MQWQRYITNKPSKDSRRILVAAEYPGGYFIYSVITGIEAFMTQGGPRPVDWWQYIEPPVINRENKIAFAIGKTSDAYSRGPFFQLSTVLNYIGNKGDFIFEIKPDEDKVTRLFRWHDTLSKWYPLPPSSKYTIIP